MASRINWKELQSLPIYNPIIMHHDDRLDNPIISLSANGPINPSFVFDIPEDTPYLYLNCSYNLDGQEASASVKAPKDEIEKLAFDCIKKGVFLFQNPIFFAYMDQALNELCDALNHIVSPIDRMFVRKDKEYVLSTGKGIIYSRDIFAGAFSGLTIKFSYNSSSGCTYTMSIPKLEVNRNFDGIYSAARFVYTDNDANLCVTLTNLQSADSKTIRCIASINKDSEDLKLSRLSSGRGWILPVDDETLLTTKKLYVPSSKFDFRLECIKPLDEGIASLMSSKPLPSSLLIRRLSAIAGEEGGE